MYVYLLRLTVGSEVRYKIGFSDDPGRRVKDLSTPGSLEIVDQYFHREAPRLERELHKRHRTKREGSRSEWFRLSDNEVKGFSRACDEESSKFAPVPVEPFVGPLSENPLRLIREWTNEKGEHWSILARDSKRTNESPELNREFVKASARVLEAASYLTENQVDAVARWLLSLPDCPK